MTLDKHAYAILNLFYNGAISNDNSISIGLIRHLLSNARSYVLYEKIKANKDVNDSNYTTICIDFIKDKYHDCPCMDEEGLCKVLKSTKQLPKWLSHYINVKNFKGEMVDNVSMTTNKYMSSAAFVPEISYHINNRYIYLTTTHDVQHLLVSAIFTDLEELAELESCGNKETDNCFDDVDFLMDAEIREPVYDIVLNRLRGVNIKYKDYLNNRNEERFVGK